MFRSWCRAPFLGGDYTGFSAIGVRVTFRAKSTKSRPTDEEGEQNKGLDRLD